MKKSPRWILALVLLQFPLNSCATAPKGAAKAAPHSAPGISVTDLPAPGAVLPPLGALPEDGLELRPLSDVLANAPDGLPALSPEEHERILREAGRLKELLLRGSRASLEARALVRDCRAERDEELSADREALCTLALKHEAKRDRRRHAGRSMASRAAKAIVRELRSGNLAALAGASDEELLHALKKTGSFSSLAKLVAKAEALPESDCGMAPLFAALGLKAEEDFPAPAAREAAERLDARAVACAPQPGLSARAAYRLGLLRAWRGDWEGLEDVYAGVLDAPDAADFRPRIAYWRYVAAGERGDFFLQEQMKAILTSEYPLNLQGLLVSEIEPDPEEEWAGEIRPKVALASKSIPRLNPLLRMAEALLAMDAREAAVEAVASEQTLIARAEGPVQLYAAVLLRRGGDTIHMFHLLTELFKQHSSLITPQALALLYPLDEYEIVSKYEESSDPYLVMSLIRQESAFNARAKSPVGALGLMQLMPRTARRLERVSKRRLLDPKVNVRIGVRYFNKLIERYGGDIELALAAYNAGPEKVDEWKARYPVADRMLFLDMIPFHETREYVASIARNYYWYLRLYGKQGAPHRGVAIKTQGSSHGNGKRSALSSFRLFSS